MAEADSNGVAAGRGFRLEPLCATVLNNQKSALRQRETLLAAFDRVIATGIPVLVLVSGYSGIGKSSLVHELDKAIVLPRGIFLSGKFDQYRRDMLVTPVQFLGHQESV